MIGDQAHILEWHGQRGIIRAHGRNWEAFSADPAPFKKGEKVLIGKVNNGIVKVNAIEEDHEPIDIMP